MRKKITALVLAVSMVSGAALSAGAAGSISDLLPESVAAAEGALEEGEQLIAQEANTEAYANADVASVVEQFNDDEDGTVATIKNVLNTLGEDVSDNAETTTGYVVNPTLYEALTTFFDLAIQDSNGTVHYNTNGSVTATLTMEVAKGRDASSLLFIQIDQETGKIYYITVDDLDAETGEITATFETLGPVVLVEKVPIVVKDTSTDLYTDRTVADIVDDFEGLTQDIEQTDVLQSMIDRSEVYREMYAETYTDEETGEEKYVTVTDEETGEEHYVPKDTFDIVITDKNSDRYGETIPITAADYTSASGFADIAIRQGQDEDGNTVYSYEMDGYYDADAQRDISNLDWYRIASVGDPELDEEEAAENMDLLVEIDPFVLTDSYAMLFSTETGEVNYIYEPTIDFIYLDDEEEETEEETEALTEAETEEMTEAEEEVAEEEVSDSLNKWDIYDEDKSDDENPVIVINGQYYALGAFVIFMPSEG